MNNSDQPIMFTQGDHVRHGKRPEWGVGVVEASQPTKYEGMIGQRLTIRFENCGRVTINTAVVSLIPADQYKPVAPRADAQITDQHSNNDVAKSEYSGFGRQSRDKSCNESRDEAMRRLSSLPQNAIDTRIPIAARLSATLDLYRFTHDLRSMFDWAVAQTGMSDPLQAYSRYELEISFISFEKKRDRHLRDLVAKAKRIDQRAKRIDQRAKRIDQHEKQIAKHEIHNDQYKKRIAKHKEHNADITILARAMKHRCLEARAALKRAMNDCR